MRRRTFSGASVAVTATRGGRATRDWSARRQSAFADASALSSASQTRT